MNQTTNPDGAQTLAEDVREFCTDRVIRIGDDYFYQHANGGERGAYRAAEKPAGTFYCYPIERTEARARLMEMGDTPEEAAEKTK